MAADKSDENIPIFDDGDSSNEITGFPERYENVQFVSEFDGIKCYRANDTRNGNSVSLYRVTKNPEDVENLEDLQHQLELVASMSHNGLISITDFDVTDSIYWTEVHVEGSSLRDAIRLAISPKMAKQLARELIEIITYINQYTTIGQLSLDDIYIDNNGSVRLSLNQMFTSLISSRRNGIIAPEQKSSRNYRSKTADQYIIASVIAAMIKPVSYFGRKQVDATIKQATHVEPTKRFKSMVDFEEAFISAYKQSIIEQWLNPKIIFTTAIIATMVTLGVIYKDPIVEKTAEIMPQSKEEIAQLNQQATTISSRLMEQLKEYEGLYNDYQNILSRGQNKKQIGITSQALKVMQSVLSMEDVTNIRAEIKGIETLIRDKQYEMAITSLAEYSSQVERAYQTALNTPKVIESRELIEKLLTYSVNKNLDEQTEQRIVNIDLRIQNRDFKGLLEELISLEEELSTNISNAQQNALRSFFSELERDMAKIPSGTFSMGTRQSGSIDTRPVHQVAIKSFSVSKKELTNNLYNKYLKLSGQRVTNSNNNEPVINISWFDIQKMVSWLNKNSNQNYRLPSESEWEYLARANINYNFPWGNSVGTGKANCKGCLGRGVAPSLNVVGSYEPNQFGLYDLHGNVWEWTEDCYSRNYDYASGDGSPAVFKQCKRRVIRGGSWSSSAKELQPFYRSAAIPEFKSDSIGFRLARD